MMMNAKKWFFIGILVLFYAILIWYGYTVARSMFFLKHYHLGVLYPNEIVLIILALLFSVRYFILEKRGIIEILLHLKKVIFPLLFFTAFFVFSTILFFARRNIDFNTALAIQYYSMAIYPFYAFMLYVFLLSFKKAHIFLLIGFFAGNILWFPKWGYTAWGPSVYLLIITLSVFSRHGKYIVWFIPLSLLSYFYQWGFSINRTNVVVIFTMLLSLFALSILHRNKIHFARILLITVTSFLLIVTTKEMKLRGYFSIQGSSFSVKFKNFFSKSGQTHMEKILMGKGDSDKNKAEALKAAYLGLSEEMKILRSRGIFHGEDSLANFGKSRTDMWKNTFKLWKKKPFFGNGFHTVVPEVIFGNVNNRWRATPFYNSDGSSPPLSPHNSYLNILARTGGLGFILWYAGLIWILVSGIKNYKRHRNILSYMSFFIVLNFMVFSMFNVGFDSPMRSMFFWLALGIFIYQNSIDNNIRVEDRNHQS